MSAGPSAKAEAHAKLFSASEGWPAFANFGANLVRAEARTRGEMDMELVDYTPALLNRLVGRLSVRFDVAEVSRAAGRTLILDEGASANHIHLDMTEVGPCPVGLRPSKAMPVNWVNTSMRRGGRPI